MPSSMLEGFKEIECKALKLEGYRNSLLNYTPLRSLEPVVFQFCEDSCTEMKTNRCSLQLVSPISSNLSQKRALLCNSHVFNLGRRARCRPESVMLQRKYQLPILFLYFNELLSFLPLLQAPTTLALTPPPTIITFVVADKDGDVFPIIQFQSIPSFLQVLKDSFYVVSFSNICFYLTHGSNNWEMESLLRRWK